MKQVLHVGCGFPNPNKLHKTFRNEGWGEIRLDINPETKPDIVASMLDMSMVQAGSIDAIWSSHNLEHVYAHEVPIVLGEFRRLLKADGFALITLPDLQAVCAYVANDNLEEVLYRSPAGPISPIDVIYGHRKSISNGNEFMAHRTGFTKKTLGRALLASGFASVRVRRGKGYDLWAVGYRENHPVVKHRQRNSVSGVQETANADE